MPSLPPWLDVKPSDFAQAAQAGIAFGQKRDALAQQAAEAAQAHAARMAAIGAQQQNELKQLEFAHQKLQQEKELSQQQIQAQKQVRDQEFRMQQARDNAAAAYKMATLSLEQNRMQQEAKDRAMNIQDIQGYWNAINSGLPAAEASAKYPRAKLFAAGTASRNSLSSPLSYFDRVEYKSLIDAAKDLDNQISKSQSEKDRPEVISAMQNRKADIQARINDIRNRISPTAPQSGIIQPSSTGAIMLQPGMKKEDLKPGTPYKNANGKIMIWNGEHFIDPEAATAGQPSNDEGQTQEEGASSE